MQLTYNKFQSAMERSSERVFEKIATAIATSDNASLVSMFDDKLVMLDEATENLYLCDYTFKDGILSMSKFEDLVLTQNDDQYLNEVVSKYFDVDDDDPISVSDIMTGFNLKYKNESSSIFEEAKDRKAKKIMESSRIRAIKQVRRIRNFFNEDVKSLMEEPFMQHLSVKMDKAQDSIPTALNKVTFKSDYGEIKVNTDLGTPATELLKLRDATNAMDAMGSIAKRVGDKWKSESFRAKFEKMINRILTTESIEMGKSSVLNFLDEHKELFLLSEEKFDELIMKTTLMLGEGNTDAVLDIFHKIMESKAAKMMRIKFLNENNLTAEKLRKLNEGDDEDSDDSDEDADAPAEDDSEESGNDLDSEEVSKIIDVFNKIKDQLEDDSPEMDYVEGIISSLDNAKVSGIEDSKMKEIIDFLSSSKEAEEEEVEENDEDDEKELDL